METGDDSEKASKWLRSTSRLYRHSVEKKKNRRGTVIVDFPQTGAWFPVQSSIWSREKKLGQAPARLSADRRWLSTQEKRWTNCQHINAINKQRLALLVQHIRVYEEKRKKKNKTSVLWWICLPDCTWKQTFSHRGFTVPTKDALLWGDRRCCSNQQMFERLLQNAWWVHQFSGCHFKRGSLSLFRSSAPRLRLSTLNFHDYSECDRHFTNLAFRTFGILARF